MRILIDLQGAQSENRFRGIGRYSVSLALAMARNAHGHEIWIALNAALPESIPAIHQSFAGWVPPERICAFATPRLATDSLSTDTWRARAAELVREHFLEQLKPDVIFISSLFEWFGNGTTTSVGQLPAGSKTAVTLYDLIPLLKPDIYLPDACERNFYYRKVESLKHAGLLLAISEYSRHEAIEALSFAEDRIVTISTAVDEHFRPIALSDEARNTLRKRYGIQRKMVMYSPGGFDFRKNFAALFSAYALLTPALRAAHQLVITSKIDDTTRLYLQQLGEAAGLGADELILTGYVSDEDLLGLYNLATLFVFPSLHEGFGLPVLEAMACGTPTLGSNSTSIPEVIGFEAALFDPASPASIAQKMAQALSDEGWRQQLREHGLQQARKFSWDNSAKIAIAAFEAWIGNESAAAPRPDAPWVIAEYAQSCRDLIAAIADQSPSLPAPDEEDLQSLTVSLAKNYRLESPYRQWMQAPLVTPTDQWCFKLMVQLFVQMDGLAQLEATQKELLARHNHLLVEREETRRLLQVEREETHRLLQVERAANQARIDKLEQLSQQWWAITEQRSHELHEVYASQSWRITRPLRQAVQHLLSTQAFTRRVLGTARQRFEQVARSPMSYVLRLLIGNAALKSFVLRVLHRYPRIRHRLAEWVQRFASPPAAAPLAHDAAAAPGYLSPRTARIYVALKQAIEAKKN